MIYKYFPNRKNNFYAKSIKKLIPFKGYNFSKDAVNITTNNFQMTNDTKYYGVNLKEAFNGRLEFRYIGGKDYQFKTKEIMELMDYFITLSWNSIDNKLSDDNIEDLRSYLDDNINNFKNSSTRKMYRFLGSQSYFLNLRISRVATFQTVVKYCSSSRQMNGPRTV